MFCAGGLSKGVIKLADSINVARKMVKTGPMSMNSTIDSDEDCLQIMSSAESIYLHITKPFGVLRPRS